MLYETSITNETMNFREEWCIEWQKQNQAILIHVSYSDYFLHHWW